MRKNRHSFPPYGRDPGSTNKTYSGHRHTPGYWKSQEITPEIQEMFLPNKLMKQAELLAGLGYEILFSMKQAHRTLYLVKRRHFR